MKKDNELSALWWVGVAILVFAALHIKNSEAGERYFDRESVPVYWVRNSKPLMDNYLALQEVSHQWSIRSGVDLQVVGARDFCPSVPSICVKFVDSFSIWLATRDPYAIAATIPYVFPDETMSRAEIMLDRDMLFEGFHECIMYILTHEFGHAVGIQGHSDNPLDVMYYDQNKCAYALTHGDVGMLSDRYNTDKCSSYVTSNLDLSVPAIMGHSVSLSWMGDGWQIIGENRNGWICSGWATGDKVTLNEVNAVLADPWQTWSGKATLRIDGDILRLEDAR